MAEDKLGQSLTELTAAISEQNKELKQKDTLKSLDKTITDLKKDGSENSAKLRESFNAVKQILENSNDARQIELAEQQLEEIKDLAGSEEENRENAKRQEEANEFLSRVVAGIDNLGDKYDKFFDQLKPSGGLLAGLGAVALLFMDPETLFEGIAAALDGVRAIIEGVEHFLNLDFQDGWNAIKDHLVAIGAIVGTIGLFFGGTIIRAFGGIFKGIQIVLRGIRAFRLFMLGTFVPSMIGFFSTISAAVAPILVAAAPFIAIGALVAAGVYAIYEAFQKAKDVFDETGSITETMVTFATDIVTAPIRWIKNLSAWVLSKLGFEELATKLNNFDITKTITDTVMGTIEWIKGIFADPVAALEKLGVALLGVDGLLGVITAPIDKAIAWVQGLFNLGDPSRPFSLYDTLYTPIDNTITWLQELFADPKAKLQEAWNGLVGEGGLIDIIYAPIDKAIAWIQGLFGWGNPEEPFKLSTLVKDAFKAAKDWVVGLFTWGSEAGTGEDGAWTLSTFISNTFTKVKTWFTGLFSWASDGLSDGWTNLTDFVKGKWTATKTWFTGLFSWAAEKSQENFIMDLFNSTIEKVKTFFTDLFDFLPSIEEIKKSITGMLPDFMQPDSIEEQRQEIQDELDLHQSKIAEGDMRYGAANVLSRENRVAELQEALSEIEGLNKGGFVNAPKSGGLAMLHGAEIVAPLDSPQGKVLMAINDLMNAKAVSGTGEYANMAPMIVNAGSSGTSNSNNSTNVSTTSYTIQQGITPDDFLKRDFLNFSY